MGKTIEFGAFEWDEAKEQENIEKHGLNFQSASQSFLDPYRLIAQDEAHSQIEPRFFCVGRVGTRIVTARFTYRKNKIRIIGAGFWRKGAKFYEKEQKKR